MTPEEIMLALPDLTLPQVQGALSYYYAHKAELDKQSKASIKGSPAYAREQRPYLRRHLARLKIYTDENVNVQVGEGLRPKA